MPGRLSYFSGGTPTAGELERVAAATERVGLVVRVRWLIIMTLAAYSTVTLGFYAFGQPIMSLARYMIVPGLALLFVAGYNTLYQFSYRRFAHIRYAPHAQIVLDVIVATVLVHYSGGVNSWFWTMYLLFTVEAAFILEDESDTWFIGAFGAALYGSLLTLEYFNLVEPVRMPFIGTGLSHNFTYVMILWSWVVVMNVTLALIGNSVARRLRGREEQLLKLTVLDAATGLYNARHFMRMLRGEVERSKRYRRRLAVLLIAIDGFADYCREYGNAEGATLSRLVSRVISGGVRRSDTEPVYDLDLTFRYSTDVLAVIAPETDADEAAFLAERLRDAIQAVCVRRPGSAVRRACTVSIGVAVYPIHATEATALLTEAENAAKAAIDAGKNRVCVAPA